MVGPTFSPMRNEDGVRLKLSDECLKTLSLFVLSKDSTIGIIKRMNMVLINAQFTVNIDAETSPYVF